MVGNFFYIYRSIVFRQWSGLDARFGIVVVGYIFRKKGESMISKLLFPVAFATACVGLVFASVPLVLAAMAITAMAGFVRTGGE